MISRRRTRRIMRDGPAPQRLAPRVRNARLDVCRPSIHSARHGVHANDQLLHAAMLRLEPFFDREQVGLVRHNGRDRHELPVHELEETAPHNYLGRVGAAAVPCLLARAPFLPLPLPAPLPMVYDESSLPRAAWGSPAGGWCWWGSLGSNARRGVRPRVAFGDGCFC